MFLLIYYLSKLFISIAFIYIFEMLLIPLAWISFSFFQISLFSSLFSFLFLLTHLSHDLLCFLKVLGILLIFLLGTRSDLESSSNHHTVPSEGSLVLKEH